MVEEKQNQVVEILAAAIPTRQLLIGKVLGNTALAVAQVVLLGVLGAIGLLATGNSGLLADIAGGAGWFPIFFLLGFVTLACLWAVVGALATRSEDIQSSSPPPTILVMGVFLLLRRHVDHVVARHVLSGRHGQAHASGPRQRADRDHLVGLPVVQPDLVEYRARSDDRGAHGDTNLRCDRSPGPRGCRCAEQHLQHQAACRRQPGLRVREDHPAGLIDRAREYALLEVA